jgi:hypothetical protein
VSDIVERKFNAYLPLTIHDSSNEEIVHECAFLGEYRNRLITDAATDMLDVSEAAAALPEADPLVTEAEES